MVVSIAIVMLGVAVLAMVAVVFLALSLLWTGFAYLNVAVLLAVLYLLVYGIPLKLNWTRNLYRDVFFEFVAYCVFCVLVYAGHFYIAGLQGPEPMRWYDYLYFSLTMWTNLGYSVFSPTPEMRVLSVLEAINGVLTLPVLGAIIWLYCTFRIRDSDRTTDGRKFLRAARSGMIGLDLDLGVGIEYPTTRRNEAEAKRSKSYRLNRCSKCGSSELIIPRYWQLPGLTPLWFYAFPLYVVKCEGCGNVCDQSRNVYVAVRSWNILNPEPANQPIVKHLDSDGEVVDNIST